MNGLLRQTDCLMKNARVPWAVCGGFALELFLGKDIRPHGDIDICVFENDRESIFRFMLENGWQVYEFRGWGRMRPLDNDSASETGRNLMCLNGTCDLVKFYPCEEEGLLYYEFFHTGIEKLNYLEFLFNTSSGGCFVFDSNPEIKRELSKAILYRNNIPYLAPEIVLLYKASRADEPAYALDFEQTYRHMDDEQRQWFSMNLDALYPEGHVWKR